MASYRRPEQLGRLLRSLAEVKAPPGSFEVVVVDDGSPVGDGVTALLEAAGAALDIDLRFTRAERNLGKAGARNAAWRLARGEWVAFTDDDCRPSPEWLIALDAAAGDERADIVVGRTEPDPGRAHLLDLPFSRSLRVEQLTEYFHTCNIAYRRSLLERLQGFDEAFRGAGEDTDLGWRAVEGGAVVAFAGDALVVHDVTTGTWHDELRDRRRWADCVRVVAKHPGARRLAWKPYVYRRSHVPVLGLVALAPLGLSPWGRRVAVAGLAGLLLSDLARSRSPVKLQMRLADAMEVGLFVRESVRQKTLLL